MIISLRTMIFFILVFVFAAAACDQAELPVKDKPQQELEEDALDRDPYFESIVYEDKNGLRYYEFKAKPQNYKDARMSCEDKGLRLMTGEEADALIEEFKAEHSNLLNWLGIQRELYVWTQEKSASSKHVYTLYALRFHGAKSFNSNVLDPPTNKGRSSKVLAPPGDKRTIRCVRVVAMHKI